MKVALLTTWKERCGIAEYAQFLTRSVPEVEFDIIDRPSWHISALTRRQYDVLHVNHEPGLFKWLGPGEICMVHQTRRPTVLTLHASQENNNRTDFTAQFNRVVVHEKTKEGFTYVPMGIPEFILVDDVKTPHVIGTAGFPFPWKGFHQVAIAANKLGYGCRVIAPESHHCDTNAMEAVCKQANSSCEYIKDWMSSYLTVSHLKECLVNVFAYGGGNYGVSGAVRLGLASGRPVVCSRCRQFRDLFDYEDEIEFCESQDPDAIAAAITRVLANGKRPARILKDMAWSLVGKKYLEIYQSVV